MTPTLIKRYLKAGWQFTIEPYTDHHKGTDEEFHYARSPRMLDKALICAPYRAGPYDPKRSDIAWEDMSETELKEWEIKSYSHQLAHSYDMRELFEKALIKAIKDTPVGKPIKVSLIIP